jgi:hypothetical protein
MFFNTPPSLGQFRRIHSRRIKLSNGYKLAVERNVPIICSLLARDALRATALKNGCDQRKAP